MGAVKRFGSNGGVCNMSQGNPHLSIKIDKYLKTLSSETLNDLRKVSKKLSDLGVFIAGIDVFNDENITEVNISNVSVFKNFIEDTGINILPEF